MTCYPSLLPTLAIVVAGSFGFGLAGFIWTAWRVGRKEAAP